jgi:hypothetical protein
MTQPSFNKIDIIRSSLIQPYASGQTIFNSSYLTDTITTGTGAKLPKLLATKDSFNQKYITRTGTNTSTITATNRIYYKCANNSWTTTICTVGTIIKDINFTATLTGTGNRILPVLDNLRICYNLLNNPAKFNTFKNSGTAVTVDKYRMTRSNNVINYTTADRIAIGDALTAILQDHATLDPNKTSFIAVTRLLKAYEYIIHVYIAMNIEPYTNDSTLTPITELILNKLNAENNSLNNNSTGYISIQDRITKIRNTYDDRLKTIDGSDILLKDLKEDVLKEKTEKNTNSNILTKNTIVYYVFLTLFIILICVLLYTLQKKGDDKSKVIVGGVVVASIVAMIIIYFLNMTYLKEGFITNIMAQANLNTYILQYLTDTLSISLMDDQYIRYSGVTQVLNKEIDRYDVINHQLKLESLGLNDIQVDDYRNARVLQYRVYLLLQIIIILSVAMAIFLYIGENVLLFGVALLLVLFVIYLYIMNTNSLVHTDAKKIYWGQPSI